MRVLQRTQLKTLNQTEAATSVVHRDHTAKSDEVSIKSIFFGDLK